MNSIKIIFTVIEKNMIPKSRNNGNDCDYIYLDMLDGDGAKNLLSFENKSISKTVKNKILELLEKNHSKGKNDLLLNL